MWKLLRDGVVGVLLLIIIMLSYAQVAQAAAAGIPFGGFTTMVIRCINPPGAVWIYMTPAGKSNPMQIWTPATKTYLKGPPTTPGQWILGLNSAMGQCVLSYKPYIALNGMVMIMVGTSGTGGSAAP